MDYIQARIDLIRWAVAAFWRGGDLGELIRKESADSEDFFSTIARSTDPSVVKRARDRLPMLCGGASNGNPYVVKRACPGSVDFKPERRDIKGAEVRIVTAYGEIPSFSLFLIRERNGRRAERAVDRGEAVALFKTHVVDEPDENESESQARKLGEFRQFDELCSEIVAEGQAADSPGRMVDELVRRSLERFSYIQGDDFSGRRRIKLMSTQARIDGFRLLIKAFKHDQSFEEVVAAEAKDLGYLMRQWAGTEDDRPISEAVTGIRPMYSAGLQGDKAVLKTIIYEVEPAEDEFTRITRDPIDGLPVWVKEIVDRSNAGVYYSLARASDVDAAWDNLLEHRTDNLFMAGLPPYEQPEATRETNDLYDSVIRDVGNVRPLWDLEERIGQTLGVYSVRRSFSLLE